jgi:hypothetical protein
MKTAQDLTGQVFGAWVVLRRAPNAENAARSVMWLCVCACGVERAVLANSLRRGRSTNCGCAARAATATRNEKHGRSPRKSYDRAYSSWKHMRQRCLNPRCRDFQYYGGRGIKICQEWTSFSAFLSDMGEPPIGHTLDRIDPNGHYGPANCRWATAAAQVANRRPFKQVGLRGERSTSAKLTSDQVVEIRRLAGTISQSELGRRFGVSQSCISQAVAGRTWAGDDR